MSSKKILFLNRSSSNTQENLDVLLMASAFNQEITVIYVDDGVFQLLSNQCSETAKQISKALSLCDVKNIFVEEDSLKMRGIQKDDLNINVTFIKKEMLATLLNQQNVIFNF